METLRGSWMRENIAVNPMYSRWTTVDERHSEDEPNDVRREDIYEAEQYQPTGLPDQLEPNATGDQLIDRTPKRDHRPGAMWPGLNLMELGALHSEDLGADEWQATDQLERTKAVTDKWGIALQQDMGATPSAQGAGDRPDLVRGLNGFAQNNPPKEMYGGEGWRRTWWQKHTYEHDLSIPQRFHRFRIVPKWVAQTDTDTPAVGGPYGASHSSLARSIKRQFAMPRLRRQPGPIDEDVVTDGTEVVESVSIGDFV